MVAAVVGFEPVDDVMQVALRDTLAGALPRCALWSSPPTHVHTVKRGKGAVDWGWNGWEGGDHVQKGAGRHSLRH